jgi:hypothetical protein
MNGTSISVNRSPSCTSISATCNSFQLVHVTGLTKPYVVHDKSVTLPASLINSSHINVQEE